MKSNKEYVGVKFNDWEVIDWVIGDRKEVEWICRCKCGAIKQQRVDNIKSGRSRMCKECAGKERRKEKEEKVEKILKMRINNHLNWTEENTFVGTYKEYLEECRRRREKEKEKRRKEVEERRKEEIEKEIGKRYGRLVVKEIIMPEKGRSKMRCLCDCGNEYVQEAAYIKFGGLKSCGCIAKEIRENAISSKRIYGIYRGMIDRCYNPKNRNYKDYGGRGIEICEEWRENVRKFIEWAYKNGYDERAEKFECTIDRIDVNGDYEPSNCRWVGMKEQAKNKRRIGPIEKRYKIYEEEMSAKEIEKRYGISEQLFRYRRKRGMSNEEAIETEKRAGIKYGRR